MSTPAEFMGSLVPEAELREALSFLMSVLEFVPLKKSLDLFYTPLVPE